MTNRELIVKFYDEVFNSRDLTHLRDYMREDYIQHNASVKDGIEGFLEFAEGFLALKPHMEIKQILENEDHIGVFFKCTLENGTVNKVMDIYRIQDGKLSEHWDIIEHDVGGIISRNGRDLF